MLNTQGLRSTTRDPLGKVGAEAVAGESWPSLMSWVILLVILLEGWAWSVGTLSSRSTSCSPGGREFVHEFGRPTEKAVKSLILKELLPKYVSGKFNSYGLSLILLRTWKGPSPWGRSLDFLWEGKRSFLKWSQTQSPGSKINALCLLLACSVYLSTFLFDLKLDVMVQVFFKTILAQHLIKYGNRKEVRGCEGIEPIHNLKRGEGSSRINYPIIGKLNMRYQVFPHPWVPGNKAPRHLIQRPCDKHTHPIMLKAPYSTEIRNNDTNWSVPLDIFMRSSWPLLPLQALPGAYHQQGSANMASSRSPLRRFVRSLMTPLPTSHKCLSWAPSTFPVSMIGASFLLPSCWWESSKRGFY